MSNADVITSLSAFTSHFKEVFGQTVSALSISDQLFNIRQGSDSVSSYPLRFWTLVALSG